MHDELNKVLTAPERGSNVSAVYTDQFTPSLQSAKPIPGRMVEGCCSVAILNFRCNHARDGGVSHCGICCGVVRWYFNKWEDQGRDPKRTFDRNASGWSVKIHRIVEKTHGGVQ